MHATLSFILSEKDPPSSLTSAFFYDDHFTQLYQDGIKRIRDKEEENYYNSLIKALEELNSVQEGPLQKPFSKEKSDATYEKNIDWLAQKREKLRLQAELYMDQEKKMLEYEKIQAKQAKIAFNLPFDYVGPIKGWQTRFQEFQRKKSFSFQPNKEDFQPKINENSKKIANFDSQPINEKVEDRLLRKAKENKEKRNENIKKFEILKEMVEQKPNKNSNRTKREILDFSVKLHEEAKRIAENRENLLKNEENRYNFQPKLNKFPKEILRKPLYSLKSPKNLEKTKKNPLDLAQWESFLNRNRKMQENKKNSAENLRKIREINELEDCSFQPRINPETVALLIQANRQGTSIVERQKEYKTRTEEDRGRLEKQREEEFKKNCTFKPEIRGKSLEKSEKKPNENGGKEEKKGKKVKTMKKMEKIDLLSQKIEEKAWKTVRKSKKMWIMK